MFDIKKFLAENTVTLNEAPDGTGKPSAADAAKLQSLNKRLMAAKDTVRKASERYFQFPDKVAINVMRQAMKEYEKVGLEAMKFVTR